ncbi:hypothetical protein ACFE04_011883 [Oxalis oulophora]
MLKFKGPHSHSLYINSELGANAILPVSIAACKAGAAEKETCVIEIKRASRDNNNNNNKKKKRDCRICHLGLVNNKNGLEEEEEEEYGGAPIHLGCSCKGDLAAAHKKCAETWFKIKGNMTCEICGATALNVGGEHIINEVNAAATTATSAALASQTPVIVVARESFWNGRRLMNFLLACGREFEPAMLSFTPSFSFGWLRVVNGVHVVVKDSADERNKDSKTEYCQ